MIRSFFITLAFCVHQVGFAQAGDLMQEKAEELMAKSLGMFGKDSTRYAVVFGKIAYQQDRPLDILKLTDDKVYTKGHIYVDQNKYEYDLGIFKLLCDSKILVYVDEMSRLMMVDSVRSISMGEKQIGVKDMFSDEYGEGQISFVKYDTIGDKIYHEIKVASPKQKNVYALYWIDAKTNTMYIYAEHSEGKYDVFVIDKIMAAPPKKYNYTVSLPQRELDSYAGYEVVDNRFVNLNKQYLKNQK